jgi:hypothetical protein
MATSYTTLLGFALPVTGELSGTWGDTVNASITQLEEDAIAGVATASVASANWNLSTTGSGASNEARKAILIPTGSPGVSRNILAPNSSKAYIVVNQSNAAVVLKGSTGPTTGVTIATGTTALCAWNGSDFVIVSQNLGNASGTLAVANGGTGLTTGTSGGVLAFTAAGTLASSAALTASALVIGGGAGVAPSTTTTAAGALTFLGTPSSANLATMVTDETGSGLLVFNSAPALTNPTVTNYVETPYSANSSTAITIALTNGTVQIITLTGNATITMPTATSGKSFIMFLKQDATGGRTVTWSTVKWPGGTAPTITATASRQDILSFFADGTNWYGVTVAQNYTP